MSSRRHTYQLTSHLGWHGLEDGSVAIWNTYFPNVRIIDSDTFERLHALPSTRSAFPATVLRRLERARIVHRGAADPSPQDFYDTINKALAEVDAVAADFYANRRPYNSLGIVNSGCNLGCSYCVSYYGDSARQSASRTAVRGENRQQAVIKVVDQYLQAKREYRHKRARFTFNGGEILLRWPLLEQVLDHVSTHYPEFQIKIQMNTNATLMTEAIAAKLAKFNAKINVSIDGYQANHNDTRHYHTGGGSFERVLAGVETVRASRRKPMDGFQGTIQNIDDFDLSALAAMSKYGFDHARLEPNLLKAPVERGKKAAYWEATAVTESQTKAVTMVNSAFERVLIQVAKGEKGYKFNCGGLMGLYPGILNLNVDSMQLSQMCSFVSPAAVPLDDVAGDIYDPKMWQRTRSYITERMQVLRTACDGCEVQGTCQGSCIYSGIDLHNKMNPAACEYQRAMWRHAIDYTHSGKIRALPEGLRSEPPATGGESCGCGSTEHQLQDQSGRRVWTITQVQ